MNAKKTPIWIGAIFWHEQRLKAFQLNAIEDSLNKAIDLSQYGKGITDLNFIYVAVKPTNRIHEEEIIYSSRKKTISLKLKLDYEEVEKTDEDTFLPYAARFFLQAINFYGKTKHRIKDFDWKSFKLDAAVLFAEKGWLSKAERDLIFGYRKNGKADPPTIWISSIFEESLVEKKFWLKSVEKTLSDQIQLHKYGTGLKTVNFIAVAVRSDNEIYEEKITYSREEKEIIIYQKLDYEAALQADSLAFNQLVALSFLNAIPLYAQKRVKNFDWKSFQQDVAALFEEEGWIQGAASN